MGKGLIRINVIDWIKSELTMANLYLTEQNSVLRKSGDRLTLYLVNQKIFKPEDFHQNPKGDGTYFRRDALKRYFVEYERMLNREFMHPVTQEHTTMRKCFRLQAEKMAAVIQKGENYVPFSLEV